MTASNPFLEGHFEAMLWFFPVPLAPKAGTHLLLEAGATQERTLEAVRCSGWFGENVCMDIGSVFSCSLGATCHMASIPTCAGRQPHLL